MPVTVVTPLEDVVPRDDSLRLFSDVEEAAGVRLLVAVVVRDAPEEVTTLCSSRALLTVRDAEEPDGVYVTPALRLENEPLGLAVA